MSEPLRRLAGFLVREGGWRAARAFGFLLAGSLTEGVSLVLLIPVIGAALGGGHVPLLAHLGLGGALAIFVAAIVLRGLLMRAKDLAMADTLFELSNRMRLQLFEQIAFAEWRVTGAMRVADLDHVFSVEIPRVQLMLFQLFQISQAAMLLVIFGAVGVAISPVITLLAAGVGGVLFVALRPLRRAAAAHGTEFSEQYRGQHRLLAAFLGSIKLAKIMNAEPAYLAALADSLGRTKAANQDFARATGNAGLLTQGVTAVGLAGFAFLAIGVFHLAFARLVVLLLAFLRIAPRLSGLQEGVHQLLLNLPAWVAVRSLGGTCEAAREVGAADLPKLAVERGIVFSRVGFAYPGGEEVFKDLSFEIPAGKITAITGPSGVGKSTVADLLLGLIEPGAGEILVDGRRLGAAERRAWRGQVAYVPQEVMLLHASVFENLRIAAPGADEAALWAALRAANALDFVAALPLGGHTLIGERGTRLSGGERQRLALARALLRKPQLLVLDEALNALDRGNEADLLGVLGRLKGEMVIVFITHQEESIRISDAVLDFGMLVRGKIGENERIF